MLRSMLLALWFCASLAAVCDVSTGTGDCAWVRPVHTFTHLINAANIHWDEFPIPIPLTDYVAPAIPVELNSHHPVTIKDSGGNTLFTNAYEATTAGSYTVIGYYDDQMRYTSQFMSNPRWVVSPTEYALTIVHFAGSLPLLVTVGNGTAMFEVRPKSFTTEVLTMPVSGSVMFTVTTSAGEVSQTRSIAGKNREVMITTLNSGEGLAVDFSDPSFILRSLIEVRPPVADEDGFSCLSALSGCGAVALGETDVCPPQCDPCLVKTQCNATLEDSDYGTTSSSIYKGGWERTKLACCIDITKFDRQTSSVTAPTLLSLLTLFVLWI